MIRQTLAFALLVATSVPLVAGGEKCSASAEQCDLEIREMFRGRQFLGVKLEKTRLGLIIRSVTPGSPAEQGGFKVDDLIVAVNGRDVSRADVRAFKQALRDGQRHEGEGIFVVTRYGKIRRLQVKLGELSPEQVEKVIQAHLREAHGDTATGH